MTAILDEIGCPKYQKPRQKGFVLDRGDRNSKIQPTRVEGAPEESFGGGLKRSLARRFPSPLFAVRSAVI